VGVGILKRGGSRVVVRGFCGGGGGSGRGGHDCRNLIAQWLEDALWCVWDH
jgi:hypothetical protein